MKHSDPFCYIDISLDIFLNIFNTCALINQDTCISSLQITFYQRSIFFLSSSIPQFYFIYIILIFNTLCHKVNTHCWLSQYISTCDIYSKLLLMNRLIIDDLPTPRSPSKTTFILYFGSPSFLLSFIQLLFRNFLIFNQYYRLLCNQMGAHDSNTIKAQINQSYTYIKKYNHSLYGDITVLQNKQTLQAYALIQKIYPDITQQTSLFIQYTLEHHHQYLISLNKVYRHRIDLCSSTQQHYYILDYYPLTLAQEIDNRSVNTHYFAIPQLNQIFISYIQAVIYLTCNQHNYSVTYNSNYSIFSNSNMAYSINSVKSIHPLFTNKQRFSNINCKDSQENFGGRQLISTQFYKSEQSKIYGVALKQQNIIFYVGICLFECVLLTDLSDVHNDSNRDIIIQQLLHQVSLRKLDDNLYFILQQMTHPKTQSRPNLKQIEHYLLQHQQHYHQILSTNTKQYHSLTPKDMVNY